MLGRLFRFRPISRPVHRFVSGKTKVPEISSSGSEYSTTDGEFSSGEFAFEDIPSDLDFSSSSDLDLEQRLLRMDLNANPPGYDKTGFQGEIHRSLGYETDDGLVQTMDKFGRTYGTGRRKTSSARVWIKEGSGQFIVNGRRIHDYFTELPREHAISPLIASLTAGYFDVWCTVKGGGTSGQAGAIRLGLARALYAWDEELKPFLRTERCLTRDSRRVERKKAGQKKARKKYQWVKR